MDVRTIRSLSFGALSYLLADARQQEAAVIDPQSADISLIRAMLGEGKLRLKWVLRTHDHDVHRPGELVALQRLGAPIVQGRAATGVHVPLDGQQLQIGSSAIHVLHTPGHTAHCLSFAWSDRVFCGSLMNVNDCPWQSWPTEPAKLWDSVTQKIFTLPDETLLFPGQDCESHSVSTVHDQRRWNPFFALCSRDDFLARMASLKEEALLQDA